MLGGLADFDQPYMTPEPDMRTVLLKDQDYVLVLGCDGLWDEMQDQDALLIAAQEVVHLMRHSPNMLQEYHESVRPSILTNAPFTYYPQYNLYPSS